MGTGRLVNAGWPMKSCFMSGILVALVVAGCSAKSERQITYNSDAMWPTIRSGDTITIRIDAPAIHEGDIVFHAIPGTRPPQRALNRVLATSGQRVDVTEEGHLLVDGEQVKRSPSGAGYALASPSYRIGTGGTVRTAALAGGSLTVPEGHVFVAGDNPTRSLDSRQWGTLPEEAILGVVALADRQQNQP